MGRKARPIKVKTLAGCWVQTSHALNQDEYFRKGYGSSRTGERTLIMFHRLMWQHVNGRVVPEGHEMLTPTR